MMAYAPPARHLLRARDLADARFRGTLDVDDMARAAAHLCAHFRPDVRRAFGESPHQYLLTRRFERAAALLRVTDRSVADICFSVGLQSVGSFTMCFTRTSRALPHRLPRRLPAGRRPRGRALVASSAPTAARKAARFEKTRRPVGVSVLDHDAHR